MSKTLAIDTSSFVMGIAITDGERTLGEVTTNIKKNHSIRLMPAINKLLKEVGVTAKELTRVVVANGPGSYTGVRIGVTTAKTLAWSLNIPVIGVSSLTVMAQTGRFFQGVIVPIMDARRGQVYTGHYEAEGMSVQLIGEDKLRMLEDWLDYLDGLNKPVLFIGQDVELHRSLIEEKLKEKALIAVGAMTLPRAAELARLGNEQKDYPHSHEFVPNYLQLAEAEKNWLNANKEKSGSND
ncbi:tRNA (adenosine(37)-N6)-threonylcarbamoyltransferase complex dimerization subunit type 1 TsaB [Halalkalibacter krulwichiae]|uniref:tRNA threonylcarbamoyladenosine biosynthesis protein TsaB n=1 Tax=Halalkalibacter krulwichiae TaxID=199441 RepID=A0A1X9M7Q1_9BACI|nr:tRNA (adenosine(37)-N6)-threonylcarbamoyltransferase complex dimerization subunit type 1 TsaB [Halalkalibacter krulwichiae]ARK28630.1 tRNA threonylcarbamoyladenosine biosynthesis protein TsaB [Halalkalibacter krulwichiae]